ARCIRFAWARNLLRPYRSTFSVRDKSLSATQRGALATDRATFGLHPASVDGRIRKSVGRAINRRGCDVPDLDQDPAPNVTACIPSLSPAPRVTTRQSTKRARSNHRAQDLDTVDPAGLTRVLDRPRLPKESVANAVRFRLGPGRSPRIRPRLPRPRRVGGS